MNYSGSVRAAVAVGFDMSHNVVSYLGLVLFSLIVVDIVNVVLQFFNLLVGDVDSEFFFTFGKRHPQLSPGRELSVGGKNLLHFITRVSGTQRVFVNVSHKPSFRWNNH